MIRTEERKKKSRGEERKKRVGKSLVNGKVFFRIKKIYLLVERKKNT